MSLLSRSLQAFENAPIPDPLRRGAVALLVARAARALESPAEGASRAFAAAMAGRPIAEHTDAANDQHYELPANFFERCLGPRLKYSCCLFPTPAATLAEAEVHALRATCEHAALENGQAILELGCGWGSLSLWMAETYPAARITAVSNSHGQRQHIEARAAALGLKNLRVITADMNVFDTDEQFDRIVSVEMFEHMSNWRALLERCRRWLAPDGRMMMHVFAHQTTPYRFELGKADWIAQHFFTGGIMPSRDLIRAFDDLFDVEEEWWWNGAHYAATARAWLEQFDADIGAIRPLLSATYGEKAQLWERRWRLFFLATEGLFGHAGGEVWGVVHHRLRPR